MKDHHTMFTSGSVAKWVARLIADPGVMSSILAQSHPCVDFFFSVIVMMCRGPGAQGIYSTHGTPNIAHRTPAAEDKLCVEIDHGIFPTIILLLPLTQEGLVSVTSESMCTK